MSGLPRTYDQWLTTDPRDAQPEDRPCKFETFSGECLVCGAGIDEECEWERGIRIRAWERERR